MVIKKFYICTNVNLNTMKKTFLYAASIAFVALGMTACGGATEASEEKSIAYVVDLDATTLSWKGTYADDSHSHTGTVKVSEGTVTYKGDTFEAGNFTVDMTAIQVTDLTAETGADKLVGHLSTEDFFNTAKFPNVEVVVNSISDSEIDATLKVAGKEIPAKMPVKVTKNDKELTAKGSFSVDFSALDANGLKENPAAEKPNQYTKPVIDFELNLVMKAEEAK